MVTSKYMFLTKWKQMKGIVDVGGFQEAQLKLDLCFGWLRQTLLCYGQCQVKSAVV